MYSNNVWHIQNQIHWLIEIEWNEMKKKKTTTKWHEKFSTTNNLKKWNEMKKKNKTKHMKQNLIKLKEESKLY